MRIEIEVEVDFDAHNGSKDTFYQPGETASADINSVCIGEIEIIGGLDPDTLYEIEEQCIIDAAEQCEI